LGTAPGTPLFRASSRLVFHDLRERVQQIRFGLVQAFAFGENLGQFLEMAGVAPFRRRFEDCRQLELQSFQIHTLVSYGGAYDASSLDRYVHRGCCGLSATAGFPATDRYKLGIDSYLNRQTQATLRMQQTASILLVEAVGGGWDVSQFPSQAQLLSRKPQGL